MATITTPLLRSSALPESKPRSNLLIYCVLLLCFPLVLSLAIRSRPTLTLSLSVPAASRNISANQFRLFLASHIHLWRGMWIRVSPNGALLNQTFHIRWFRYLPKNAKNQTQILQTNTYTEPTWPLDGVIFKQWLYTNSNPPIFGRRIHANNTLASPLPGYLPFYPRHWLIWTYKNIHRPFFFSEKFLFDPRDNNIRLSVTWVFRGGVFKRVSFAREVADVDVFPGTKSVWTKNTISRVRNKLMRMDGVWSGWKECVGKGFLFWRSPVVAAGGMSCGNGERVVLQLPDNMFVSFPKIISKQHANVLCLQWVLDKDLVVFSQTTFDKMGEFQSDCSTVYRKVATVSSGK